MPVSNEIPGGLNSTKAMILLDLQQNQLGLGPGEGNLSTPFNYAPPKARIFMVNHSGLVTRRIVKIAVSGKRGAAEALRSDAELRKVYNASGLREEAANGNDMNVYAEVKKPITYQFEWDGKKFYIPPAVTDDPAQMQEGRDYFKVPDGVWDKFNGNYERMNGDARTRSEEAQRLGVMWAMRHNPVMRITDDGTVSKPQGDNPFGFIEFIRISDVEAPQVLDKAFLTASELAEA